MHTHLYGGLWETRAIQKLWERTSTLYVLRSTGCAEMERRQAHRHAGRDAEDAARRGEHQRQHEADVAPSRASGGSPPVRRPPQRRLHSRHGDLSGVQLDE